MSEVRQELNDYWNQVDRDFMERKESHGAVTELKRLYRRFDNEEQRMAREIIVEWLRSPEPRKQFDALILVDEFLIVDALPTLRKLQAEAESRADHEAPYDWARLNRIVGRLSEAQENRKTSTNADPDAC